MCRLFELSGAGSRTVSFREPNRVRSGYSTGTGLEQAVWLSVSNWNSIKNCSVGNQIVCDLAVSQELEWAVWLSVSNWNWIENCSVGNQIVCDLAVSQELEWAVWLSVSNWNWITNGAVSDYLSVTGTGSRTESCCKPNRVRSGYSTGTESSYRTICQ